MKKLPRSTFSLKDYKATRDTSTSNKWDCESDPFDDLMKKAIPSDFYFRVDHVDDPVVITSITSVSVVARVYFKKRGYMDDCSLPIEHLLPDYLGESMESVWDCLDSSKEKVRQDMLDKGFIENEELEEIE